MPTKKTTTKSSSGADELKKIGKEVTSKLNILKKKYNQLDEKTKKNIVASIVGVAAVVAGIGAAKKTAKKIKKNKKKK